MGAPDKRIDANGLTVLWGDATRWKSRLREESRARHMKKPVGERLRVALSLLVPKKPNGG